MSLNEHQQKKYDELFEQLKGCESHALAQSLSMMLVFSFNSSTTIKSVIENCRHNSAVIRRNRDNALILKNKERYLQLCNKKKLTQAETAEAVKLQKWFTKKLNIKDQA